MVSELTRATLPDGGSLVEFLYHAVRIKPGTVRRVSVHLPSKLPERGEIALQVHFDGRPGPETEVVERLVREGAMPPLAVIGVAPGVFPASLPGGTDRSVRSPEYDGLGPSLPTLLADALVPEIASLLPEGVSFSASPDMHAVAGCSSGGIAAWNACWERNDFFRRCYANSPTFSCFRGGDAFPFLIRKYETKPVRVFMTCGTDDMRNSAGDWHLEGLSAREALEYAGYEYEFLLFEGGKHGEGMHDAGTFERACRFIWKDWKTRPVGIRHFPERVADIFAPGTVWTPADAMPPAPPALGPAGEYVVADGSVLLRRPGGGARAVLSPGPGPGALPGPAAAVALSCDRWRLYVAVPSKRFVYAYAVRPDGSLADGYAHAHLHIRDDADVIGALSVCVDTGDRLYAATEPGVQTISQQGENNCVLAAPGHDPVREVAFGTAGGGSALFVRTLSGKIWSRPALTRGLSADTPVLPPDTPPF